MHTHEWLIQWVTDRDLMGEAIGTGYVIYCTCGAEYAPEDLILEITENENLRAELEDLRIEFEEFTWDA